MRCNKKGSLQSFLQIKVLHAVFKFPVQTLVLKKAPSFHMMKGALLTEKTSYFLLFWFPAGQDVQMVLWVFLWFVGGEKKRTDDTEAQKRLTGSLACTPGVWLKDSCFLKLWVVRDDRLITQWKVSYDFAVWTYLAAFHCLGSSGCEGSWESTTLMFCWIFCGTY